ncbi:Eukaryotic translation initiation factor 5A [Spironucleus salmonicida]|uniref:Eukaryotic translation initiation factor 5A n=1 Tax=Spironucleus salmonicida TaxID=348837 RepID=V6LRT5_9EUKA|nr:Eukaryotic translation initiation factor 5A [Spironucleus salmonicida]|eukprot:EST46973.1 Eukaryotic translation initiation factor 5A [Spironucleus salmonicida]
MSASGDPSYPKAAGELGKGDYIVIQDKFPCKISEYSSSKTGKHGHAKASITAIDIFTGKKYEDSCPTSHNVNCPHVFTFNYQMTSYDDEYIQYIDDAGIEGEIQRPTFPEGLDTQLVEAFETAMNDSINIVITVQTAMGTCQVMSFRTDRN